MDRANLNSHLLLGLFENGVPPIPADDSRFSHLETVQIDWGIVHF